MKKKSLAQTNKYLKEPAESAKLIKRSVLTSTAVEGINAKLPATKRRTASKSKPTKKTIVGKNKIKKHDS